MTIDRTAGHAFQKANIQQSLRYGELARASASNQGVTPGSYEAIKRNRPVTALDHIDYHQFALKPAEIVAHCKDLTLRNTSDR